MFANAFRDFKTNRNKYTVEQAVQFIFELGDESELSKLDDNDDDHDEISAYNNHRVEIEDDIEGCYKWGTSQWQSRKKYF